MNRTPVRSATIPFVATVWCLCLSTCGGSPVEPAPMVDSGSWYQTGFRWPHDGAPYESEHFIVFSDAASLDARIKLAAIGEELLASLRQDFGVTSDTLFRFPAGQSKIDMYAYKDHFPQDWGGRAYYGGIMMYSLDNARHVGAGHTELQLYTRVVKHELMHTIEFLLRGSSDPNLVDAWLTEGLGEFVSGGTAGGSVTSLAKLDSLTEEYGALNPIAMHQYRYPNVPMIDYYYYYPMFELAVKYLLDPAGAARPKSGVRDIFLDVRKGVPFAASFETRMGLSLTDFEDQFFEWIRGYLH